MATPSKAASKSVSAKAADVTTKAGRVKAAKPVPEAPREREKLVRDSFKIPKNEYEELGNLKQRTIGLARPAKKSELLRAGVKALSAMSDAALLAALKAVPTIKTGRPAAAVEAHAPKAGKGKDS